MNATAEVSISPADTLPVDPFGIDETVAPSIPMNTEPGIDLVTLQEGARMSTTQATSGPGVSTWEELDSIMGLVGNVYAAGKLPAGSTPAQGDTTTINLLARLGLGPAGQTKAPTVKAPAVESAPATSRAKFWIIVLVAAVLGFLAAKWLGLILGAVAGLVAGKALGF
jgi:hypothetical protein